MQGAGSSLRHHSSQGEDGASLEDRKEATQKAALGTQGDLGHKSSVSERKQAATSQLP